MLEDLSTCFITSWGSFVVGDVIVDRNIKTIYAVFIINNYKALALNFKDFIRLILTNH